MGAMVYGGEAAVESPKSAAYHGIGADAPVLVSVVTSKSGM